jgi:hypothetical protein
VGDESTGGRHAGSERADHPDQLQDRAVTTEERDSLTEFFYKQRQRMRAKLEASGKRVTKAQRAAQQAADLAWETRGKVTGYHGMTVRERD